MSLNELVTYIEELTFRTTMFGYDRDEVDIQLDKINDEIMALVKAKDEEIAALKSGKVIVEQAAPAADRASETGDADEAADGDEEGFSLYKDRGIREDSLFGKESAGAGSSGKDQEEGDREELEKQLAADKDRIRGLEARITELEQELEEMTKRAEHAEAAADEAAEKAHSFAARVEELESGLAVFEEESGNEPEEDKDSSTSGLTAARDSEPKEGEEEEEEDGPAFLLLDEKTEETFEPERSRPASTEEAYSQYLRNADLLCKQLTLIDDQKEGILTGAREEADGILSDARTEAETIVSHAAETADRLVSEASEEADNILREIEDKRQALLDEVYAERDEKLKNLEEDKLVYQELVEKKAAILRSLRDLSDEVGALAEDYDVESEEME